MTFRVPNKYRIRTGPLASSDSIGNAGAFEIKLPRGQTVFAIASDAMGWEHVSVSRSDRCPTWDEMCQVKALFWGDDDCVVQFHPPKRDYVNIHEFCLHMWCPVGIEFPQPDSLMIGPKTGA